MSPEISYANLAVQNGTMAMQVFGIMNKMTIEAQHEARKALLKYCHTDVLSMVHILKNLNKIVKKEAI